MSSKVPEQKQSFFYKNIFPIDRKERPKFFYLMSIFFFVAFNYSLLRGVKDVLVLSLKGGGAAAIAAAKFAGVIPAMFLFKVGYDIVNKHASRQMRFNIVISYFVTFFTLYVFILNPYGGWLELHNFAAKIMQYEWVARYDNFVLMIEYWPTVIYYIHAEAWGALVLSVCYWTFVNGITGIDQSKRFFGTLMVGSSTATILAGLVLLSNLFSIRFLVGIAVVSALILLIVYNIFEQKIQKSPDYYQVVEGKKKKKKKLSMAESFRFLLQSRYLALIAVIVVGYALASNLLEAVYRDCLVELAKRGDLEFFGFVLTGKKAILKFFGGFQLWGIGFMQLLFSLFLVNAISRRSWRFAAAFTPTVLLINAILFFSIIFLGDGLVALSSFFSQENILTTVVWLGVANIIIVKSTKYVLFDSTKERLFVPADPVTQTSGKSAVDTVGSRLGKGMGAFIVGVILKPFFGTVSAMRPLLAIIILLVVLAWLIAVGNLSGRFALLTQAKKNASDKKVSDK